MVAKISAWFYTYMKSITEISFLYLKCNFYESCQKRTIKVELHENIGSSEFNFITIQSYSKKFFVTINRPV